MGGLYKSYFHSTLHIPAGTWVRLLPLLRKDYGNAFKRHLRIDSEKALHQGEKWGEVSTLVLKIVEVIPFLFALGCLHALL